jgi:hypothetical protein
MPMLKILILPIVFLFHPVHVTLTTIEKVEGTDTINVHFRMYYDDFLRDFELYDKDYKPGNISVNESFPAGLANNYFNDKVQLSVNNKLLTGKVLSVTIRDNEIFLELIYQTDIYPKKIRIINKVLTGLYSDQTNMIFIKFDKHEQALRLTPEHVKETWSFVK